MIWKAPFFGRTAFQAWAKISLGEAQSRNQPHTECHLVELVLEQMRNLLLTLDKGQRQEVWACQGSLVWSLGLPVQTTERGSCLSLAFARRNRSPFEEHFGGKRKAVFNTK